MFKYFRSPILWGVLLILGGIALLLENLVGWNLGDLFWGVVFLLGGVIFISEFVVQGKAYWWALIPGVTLLGLGAINFLDVFLPRLEALSGAVFLGSISLGFFLVYIVMRENWWAIIPGGVLATLAAVSFLDDSQALAIDTGGIFFIGLGITFLLVALLPTPAGKMTWAYIPGGILVLFGLLLSTQMANVARYLIPGAIILGGLVMVVRALQRSGTES